MKEEIYTSVSDTGNSGMGKGLSVKRANRFFLCYTLLSTAFMFIPIPFLPQTWASLVYYIIMVIIALAFCRKEGIRLGSAFGFRRVRLLTLLTTVVIYIGMHQVSHLVSSLTNLLFPSFLEMAGKQLLGGGFWVSFVGVALIPAFFEEFVVRGSMVSSYMRTGRLRASVLLTALLFGLMHINATQFFYSIIMGIVLALLFVLTDSIWPGILFHFLNNAMAPLSELLAERFGDEFVQRTIFPLSRGLSDPKSALITVISAVVGLLVTVICLYLIARFERSEDKLRLCIRGGGGKEKLVTPALVISIVILVVLTVALTIAVTIRMQSM